jgi:hypothetical protein
LRAIDGDCRFSIRQLADQPLTHVTELMEIININFQIPTIIQISNLKSQNSCHAGKIQNKFSSKRMQRYIATLQFPTVEANKICIFL